MNTAVKSNGKKEAKIISLNTSSQQARKLIRAAWITSKSTFWNNEKFTKRERETLEKLMSAHFADTSDSRKRFLEIVERFCLVRRYLGRKPGRYIHKPLDWLNIHFKFGFVKTESWLKEIQEQRKTAPYYNKGIATLAKGILAFIDSPEAGTFHKYRNSLIEQKQFDLLPVYYTTIINLQFSE